MSNYIDNETDASYALEEVLLGEASQNRIDRLNALDSAKDFITESHYKAVEEAIHNLFNYEYDLQFMIEEICDELKNNMVYNK
jgi:hypothetical protein